MENLVKDFRVGNRVSVNRFKNNDCWNIALALALNMDYNKVRNYI